MGLIDPASRVRWVVVSLVFLALAAGLGWRSYRQPAPGSVEAVPAERIVASAYGVLEFLAQDRDDSRRMQRIRGRRVTWAVRLAARTGTTARYLTGAADEPQIVLADAVAGAAVGSSGLLSGTLDGVDASGAIRLVDVAWSDRP